LASVTMTLEVTATDWAGPKEAALLQEQIVWA
jgi:hypothetical protein